MAGKNRILKQKILSVIKHLSKKAANTGNLSNEEINSLLILLSAIISTEEDDSALKFILTATKREYPVLDRNDVLELLNKKYTLTDIKKSASFISSKNLAFKELLLQYLIELACINNKYTKREQEIVNVVRIEFSISEAHAYELWKKANKNTEKNGNIMGSGTALLIVIIIIIVFILAASFFLSVIFGLILAYFFLPLQFWFKNSFFPGKFSRTISATIKTILSPITAILNKLKKILPKKRKLSSEPKISAEELEEIKLIQYSCRATITLVMTVFIVFLLAATLFSTTYFAYLTKSISNWAEQTTENYQQHEKTKQVANNSNDIQRKNTTKHQKLNTHGKDTLEASAKTSPKKVDDKSTQVIQKDFFKALIFKIESYKPKLEKLPFFKIFKDNIKKYFNNAENRKKLIMFILDKVGGFFSYTAGAIGTIFMILMNIVLTLFFFAFFINHMARFNNSIDEKATAGEHIVNGILNSGWLPNTTRETRFGAIQILNNIFERLRSWIRGYLTIIIIETVFYVTTFLLVGVPYGAILGTLAGFTILLPYIGPMISIVLTLTACLALGSGGMLQLTIVVLLYIIMNGIIEQLFIYPSIVGGALGLNEFETIVIVLLGGILAGIPGMIFAVPVASILKYLIPEVYKFLQGKRIKNISITKT